MNPRVLFVWLTLPVLALGAGAGDKPEVEVVQPVSREVSDYEDSTGKTDASATVVLKARVSGYLTKVHFKDGAEVKKGDVLFEIDPRPYKAALEKADAGVSVAQAALAKAETNHKRVKASFDRKAAGKDELDKAAAAQEEAQARLRAARSARKVARLNLDFTKVTAPISGRIGRRRLEAGNVVKADVTDLATLVQAKPLYVFFELDEKTFLRLRREKAKALQVAVGLANEKGFPHRAEVDFVSNRVDPKTGALRLRANLPNPDGLFKPGLFVRVRLTTSKPYKALLIPDKAVSSDAGQKFVFVINQKDKIEVRKVRMGLRQGDLVVVKDGLTADDRVVLSGLQRLRAGMTVRPKKASSPEEK